MYTIRYSPGALQSLKQIRREDASRIVRALEDLAALPEPAVRLKRLEGGRTRPFYSLRVGDYRAILAFERKVLVIFVLVVENRRSAYRDF